MSSAQMAKTLSEKKTEENSKKDEKITAERMRQMLQNHPSTRLELEFGGSDPELFEEVKGSDFMSYFNEVYAGLKGSYFEELRIKLASTTIESNPLQDLCGNLPATCKCVTILCGDHTKVPISADKIISFFQSSSVTCLDLLNVDKTTDEGRDNNINALAEYLTKHPEKKLFLKDGDWKSQLDNAMKEIRLQKNFSEKLYEAVQCSVARKD